MKRKWLWLLIGFVFLLGSILVVIMTSTDHYRTESFLVKFYDALYQGYLSPEDPDLPAKFICGDSLQCRNLLADYHNLVLGRQVVRELDHELFQATTQKHPYRIQIDELSVEGNLTHVRFHIIHEVELATYPPFLLSQYQHWATLEKDAIGYMILDLSNEFAEVDSRLQQEIQRRDYDELFQFYKQYNG